MSHLTDVIKAISEDHGTVMISFSNGAAKVYIDLEDEHLSAIGGKYAPLSEILPYIEKHEKSIEDVV